MSRPDSMIVVQTSTSASPRRNSEHHAPRARPRPSARGATTKRIPGQSRAAARPSRRSSRRGCAGRTPGRRGHARARSPARRASSSYSPTNVRTGRRPSGGVSITEMSRRPASDMCSVRGIGVADIASTSTWSRSCRSSSFCVTPKRCSSSTITSPRSLARTSRDSRRWVPIRMSTSPLGESRRSPSCCLRGAAKARDVLDREREVRRDARVKVPKCCWARIVVGTSISTWRAVVRRP